MPKNDVRDHYNQWYQQLSKQEDYHPVTQSLYKQAVQGVKKYTDGRRLLDVACGRGELLMEARALGFEVKGVDISDTALKKARARDLDVQRSGAEKLPFSANTFDAVTCIGSLEHFEDKKKALQEMARVTQKDGVIFLHLPNLMFLGHIYMAWRYGSMPSEGGQHFSEEYLTYQGWEQLLASAGLKVVKVEKYNQVVASKKVSPAIIFIWQYLLKPFIPFNLSYAFNVYCRP